MDICLRRVQHSISFGHLPYLRHPLREVTLFINPSTLTACIFHEKTRGTNTTGEKKTAQSKQSKIFPMLNLSRTCILNLEYFDVVHHEIVNFLIFSRNWLGIHSFSIWRKIATQRAIEIFLELFFVKLSFFSSEFDQFFGSDF